MTNKQTLPDIIEIDGVKYVKVVEESQKPKTLYQMFYDDNRWSTSVSNEFCDTVERWMSQYICDYVACEEFLDGYDTAMKMLKENLR